MTLTNNQKDALNLFSSNQAELNNEEQSGNIRGPLTGADSDIRLGNIIYDLQTNSGGSTGTTGEITLAVSTTGTDRSATILEGDYSSTPFLTLQSALDALPTLLNFDVTINLGSGTLGGGVASGFLGKGVLKIVGTTALAAITSGSNSGTAGLGTTSTSINKPTGSSNWTAGNLRGKFLVVTAGGGASGDSSFPTVRAIKTNATTTISVDTILGADSTTQFQIVNIVSLLSDASDAINDSVACLGFNDCQNPIKTTFIKTAPIDADYGIYSLNCYNIDNSGTYVVDATLYGSYFNFCENINFNNNYINTADCLIESVNILSAQGNTSDNGTLWHVNGLLSEISVDAASCSSNAVKISNLNAATLGLNANNCFITPCVLQNINQFQINTELTGTNASLTSVAVSIAGGGQFIMTGADISGTVNDFSLESVGGTWSALSTAGTYVRNGSYVYWATGRTVLKDNFQVDGQIFGYQGYIQSKNASYTLTAGDSGTIIEVNTSATSTITCPSSLTKGFCATVVQSGTGMVVFSGSVFNANSHNATRAKYSLATVYISSNVSGTNAVWILAGDTVAS